MTKAELKADAEQLLLGGPIDIAYLKELRSASGQARKRIAKLLSGPRRTAPLEALPLHASARSRSAAIRTRLAALLG